MFKNFAILAALVISAYAPAAVAVIVQTQPHRSAIQNECIKENPKDHQGYLNCVHSKKANNNKKNTDGKGDSVPANRPDTDINQPVEADKYK